MTDSPRDTSDLTKLGYISHLDIYRDHTRMFVMPGYVSENGFGGNANGLKTYDIQDIAVSSNTILYALGKKSDGTGSKLFEKRTTDNEWIVPVTFFSAANEGSDDLVAKPFLATGLDAGLVYYPVQLSGQIRLARIDGSSYSNSWSAVSVGTASATDRLNHIQAPNGNFYFFTPNFSGVHLIQTSGVTADAKSTALGVTDIAEGDYTVSIAGFNSGRFARNLIWDNASLLADQNNAIGRGVPKVAGSIAGTYVYAIDEFMTASSINDFLDNGRSRMSVKMLLGETVETMYALDAVQDSTNDLYPTKGRWRDSVTWYAKAKLNDTETKAGIWAIGKADSLSQIGVSVLLDTSSLGDVRNARWIGNTCWLINHSGDKSVSRLADLTTGTYNVPATIETLIYGADSPYQKELKGISIVTEDLPSGGSVVCSYRIDEDSAWTTMGTSDTTGKRRHSFTKANGTPIGKFQEIQFKIVITGKTAIKNIRVDLVETDNLPY